MQTAVKHSFMMEADKIIIATVSALALTFTIFSFFSNRKKEKTRKEMDDHAELEKAHLTDSAVFRAELRAEVKELKTEVKALQKELRETENELDLTKQDLFDLQKEFSELALEKKKLEADKESLLGRVRELEKQVKAIHQSND